MFLLIYGSKAKTMYNKIMMVIGLIIFSAWTIRLDYKIFDRKLKKYVIGIGGLLVFWLIIRLTKIYYDLTFL